MRAHQTKLEREREKRGCIANWASSAYLLIRAWDARGVSPSLRTEQIGARGSLSYTLSILAARVVNIKFIRQTGCAKAFDEKSGARTKCVAPSRRRRRPDMALYYSERERNCCLHFAKLPSCKLITQAGWQLRPRTQEMGAVNKVSKVVHTKQETSTLRRERPKI